MHSSIHSSILPFIHQCQELLSLGGKRGGFLCIRTYVNTYIHTHTHTYTRTLSPALSAVASTIVARLPSLRRQLGPSIHPSIHPLINRGRLSSSCVSSRVSKGEKKNRIIIRRKGLCLRWALAKFPFQPPSGP